MKAEFVFPDEFVNQIADRVIQKIKPFLVGNGDKTKEDIYLNVTDITKLLKVSPKWVYSRVQFNEIPYEKIRGLVRFKKKDITKWLNGHNVPYINSIEHRKTKRS